MEMNTELIRLIVVGILLVASVVGMTLSRKRRQLFEENKKEKMFLFEPVHFIFYLLTLFFLMVSSACFYNWLQTIPSGVIK